jgi:hypothetical protein
VRSCPGNGPACPGPRFLNQGRPCTPANGGGRRLTQAGTAKHKEVVHGTTTCPRCYLGHCVNFRWEWWKEIKNGTKMYKCVLRCVLPLCAGMHAASCVCV